LGARVGLPVDGLGGRTDLVSALAHEQKAKINYSRLVSKIQTTVGQPSRPKWLNAVRTAHWSMRVIPHRLTADKCGKSDSYLALAYKHNMLLRLQ
jgi:hypothetical protein